MAITSANAVIGAQPTAAETEASKQESLLRLQEELSQQAQGGNEALQGIEEQFGPLEGPQGVQGEGEYTREDLIQLGIIDETDMVAEGSQLETPVSDLGLAEATVLPAQADVGSQGVGSVVEEGSNVFVDQAETPLEVQQREQERVPGPLERMGIATSFSNAANVLGHELTERVRFKTRDSQDRDVIGLSIKDTLKLNPDEEVTAEAIEQMQTQDDVAPNVFKDNPDLKLSMSNLVMHPKILGVGKLDAKFERDTAQAYADGEADFEEISYARTAKVDPRFDLIQMAVIEPWLLSMSQANNDDGSSLSAAAQADIDELQGYQAGDSKFDTSVRGVGEAIFKDFRRAKSEMEGLETDSYVADYQNLTPEAFEMIGKIFLADYQMSFPDIVTHSPGGIDEAGNILPPTLSLTKLGFQILSRDVRKYKPFNPRMKPLLSPPATGQPMYEGSAYTKSSTGSVPNPKSISADDAMFSYSQVPNYFEPRRSKIAILLGSAAMGQAAMGANGNPLLDMFDIGDERKASIAKIAENENARGLVLQAKLDKALLVEPSSPAYYRTVFLIEKLQQDIEISKLQEAKFRTPEFQQQQYYMHANKALEVLTSLSVYDNKPFYFTYFKQRVTQRLTPHSSLSPVNNHLVRNIIGSGKMIEVIPNSRSREESNWLATMSALFYDGGGLVRADAIEQAAGNIRTQSEAHKRLVRIGKKINEALQAYDDKPARLALSQIMVNSNGVSGVDKLPTRVPAALSSDPEVADFIQGLANNKKAHKHAIQMIDAVIDIANYDAAMKAGKSFRSAVNYMEIDGISNGLATMFSILGLKEKLYRVGLFRAENASKILGAYSDIEGFEAYEGDIRKTLSNNLETLLDSEFSGYMLTDKAFMDKYSYDETMLDNVRELFQLSLKNKADFLKKPLMTFAYGQEMDNLIGSVWDTLLSDPTLKQAAESFPGGLNNAAMLLNDIRGVAVEATLGPELVEFAALLKDSVDASTMFNRMVTFPSPSGGKTTLGGMEKVYDTESFKRGMITPFENGKRLDSKTIAGNRKVNKGIQDSISRAEAEGNLVRADALRKQLKSVDQRIQTTSANPQLTPYAAQGGILGGKARGSSLATLAQSFDAMNMIMLASGKNWTKLTQGDNMPWLSPIYDAVVTDLSQGDIVEQMLNDDWFDQTNNSAVLKDIKDVVTGNIHHGFKEFKRRGEQAGKELIMEDEHNNTVEFVRNQLNYLDVDGPLKEEAERLAARLKPHQYKGLEIETPNPYRNYATLSESMSFLMKWKFGSVVKDLARLDRDSAERRRGVAKHMKDAHYQYVSAASGEGKARGIYQFAMDDPKFKTTLQ